MEDPHESLEAVVTASADSTVADLPAPLLANKVTDVASLFVHGRLLGKLRDSAFRLVDEVDRDDPVVDVVAERYTELRDKVIGLISEHEVRTSANQLIPACGDKPSLAQLAFAADQASTWIEAISEVDGFVLSQQMAAIGTAKATASALDEHRKIVAAAEDAAAKPHQLGQYL